MRLSEFNKTLEWHEQAILKSSVNCEELLIEFSDVAGGPGEGVKAFIKFKSVCFVSAPTVIEVSKHLKLMECSYKEARDLLPGEYLLNADEYGKDGLLVIRFHNGNTPLPYFVLSYGYELWQVPKNWSYPAL